MHVFFANPEPSFLVADRLTAGFADPIHHAHCIRLGEGLFFIAGHSRPGAIRGAFLPESSCVDAEDQNADSGTDPIPVHIADQREIAKLSTIERI